VSRRQWSVVGYDNESRKHEMFKANFRGFGLLFFRDEKMNIEHPTSNVQHPTSNFELFADRQRRTCHPKPGARNP